MGMSFIARLSFINADRTGASQEIKTVLYSEVEWSLSIDRGHTGSLGGILYREAVLYSEVDHEWHRETVLYSEVE